MFSPRGKKDEPKKEEKSKIGLTFEMGDVYESTTEPHTMIVVMVTDKLFMVADHYGNRPMQTLTFQAYKKGGRELNIDAFTELVDSKQYKYTHSLWKQWEEIARKK